MTDPRPEPGERRPAATPRLDRAPGERYGTGATALTGSPEAAGARRRPWIRSLVAADLVAAIGAVVVFLLGMLDIGPGLIAVAAAIGWAVALAMVWGGGARSFRGPGTGTVLAAGLAAGAIVVGFLLNWAWSRAEGGVLDPVAYLDQRYGLFALVDIAAAGLAGAIRAR